MTSNQHSINVLLYGFGALGSFYAFILQQSPNVRLTAVARSNYNAVTARGMKIISANHGEHIFHPYKVVKTLAEAAGDYDYVVCANKAINQDQLAENLRGVVGDGTTIVLIQNGVGNEEPFRHVFPRASILSCVAWTGGVQTEPGVVHHTPSEHLYLGLYENEGVEESVEQHRQEVFAALLAYGKSPCTVWGRKEIQVQRWEKVIWNCAWNALTALTRLHTHAWLTSSPSALPMTRTLMSEVLSVAKASGLEMRDGLVDELIAKIQAMHSIGTSMLTDVEEGRRLELDVILGVPVRKGKELGVAMPVMEVVYTLIQAIDEGIKAKIEGSAN
ncbi:2-dehydropantoate 2-reductase [Coleophoma cylindrospora]|uniref:2-dehydropantoate 2-reductase n=1 Tax=Coleophoma cylindrospora TaxID=1849047 RepID=A0A3D8R0K9_9HELO|nr:2-dehydropantoate 2-reductase [Coleophoma cylindrospora]